MSGERNSFKEIHSFETRKVETERIRGKYPNHLPVIIQGSERCEIQNLKNKKYLVPSDVTLGHLIKFLHQRMGLPPDKNLCIFVNNSIPSLKVLMSQLDKEQKDVDGFLYLTYSGESKSGPFPKLQKVKKKGENPMHTLRARRQMKPLIVNIHITLRRQDL